MECRLCGTTIETNGMYVVCKRCGARYYRNQVHYRCVKCKVHYHTIYPLEDKIRQPRYEQGICPECEKEER